jgi:nucleoside-diphosphate-sugar epimerase
MRILITGNMGYVGPAVVRHLRAAHPDAELHGLDIGFFASCLTTRDALPETRLDLQHFADVRDFPTRGLEGVDAIVHLAAISNDPMGKLYEQVTLEINHLATVELARKAKQAGVGSFIFASSCSMYGEAEGGPRTEDSPLNPLTAYARSKVFAERDLQPLADDTFTVTCLRFSTACGWSDRLRLDLVLNDFVAGAVASHTISILSDGTPWRPLIHVNDMARACDWALGRRAAAAGPAFLAVNVGHESSNYRVSELAAAVARAIPDTAVHVNEHAPHDKRSYRVDFGLFKQLAPSHQPAYDLATTIGELRDGLVGMDFRDGDFRSSSLMRLVYLNQLRDRGRLSASLQWTQRASPSAPAQ